MKTALLFGLLDIRVVETPYPKIKPNSVIIKVDACGICPTDIRKYHTIYGGKMDLPTNLGHEFVGTVVEVGSDVKNIEIGSKIVGDGYVGYADYALVDFDLKPPIHIPDPLIVPSDLSDNVATFVEPLSCCYHGVFDRLALQKDQTVLIIGGGTMGQLLLIVAKSAGAKVILSEPYSARRDMAISLGADLVIDPQEENISKAVIGFTENRFVDAVILTIGNPSSVQDCVDVVKPCGKVLLFGRFPPGAKFEIDGEKVYKNEISIMGSYWIGGSLACSNVTAYQKALALLKEQVTKVEKLISEVYPLSKIHQAFTAASSMDTFKVIVVPDIDHEEST